MIQLILIDDHTVVRNGIRLMLKAAPTIQVIGEAGTGIEGVQLARELQPDVVLLDLKLPDISGIEVTTRLLRLNPVPKILLLSSATHTEFPSRSLEIGALGYLTKDTSSEELIRAIKTVNKNQPVISQALVQRLALNKIAPQSHALFKTLTHKEIEVLLQTVRGISPQDISKRLHMSPKTVHSYRGQIFRKLGVKNNVTLTLLVVREGLMDLEDANG